MEILSIILFIVYIWGLGFTLTAPAKEAKDILERNIMRAGIGLGGMVLAISLLNLFRIPIDWRIILALSLVYPAASLFRKRRKMPKPDFRLTKSNLNTYLAVLFSLFCLYMYLSGSFSYPYLEDDDPWKHTVGISYVAFEKEAYDPEGLDIKYLDPYPPGFDGVLGVIHQTNDSLYWTMKFFNSLFIALGILFFFFFAKRFTGDSTIAMLATATLAAVPSYFTHFIWAHTLVITLFFPAMYSLTMISRNRGWKYPAMAAISSVLLTQPSEALKIMAMIGIYFIIRWIYARRFLKQESIAIAGGLILSLSWWGTRGIAILAERATKYANKFEPSAAQAIEQSGVLSKLGYFLTNYFRPDLGTASRSYSFMDFFVARPKGMINVQVGWGIAATLLIAAGIIFIFMRPGALKKKKSMWITVTLAWFLFTFLGTNSMTFHLPVGFFAFRFWLLLAIPASLLAAYGAVSLAKVSSKAGIPAVLVIILALAGIALTSAAQKYEHNTNPAWPYGVGFTSPDELKAHLFLMTLPKETKVFHYHQKTDLFILGMDMYSCSWCPEILSFRKKILNASEQELYSFLKRNQYEYIVIGGISYKYLSKYIDENRTREYLPKLTEEMSSSGHFSIAYQTKGAVIFRVL